MIKNGIIFILILLSLFLFEFRIPTTTVTKTKIDTVVTTKTLTKYIKGNKIPFKVLDTIFTNIYKEKHDTAYIVKDYNQVKEYTDSIKQENSLKHTPLINEDFTSITSLIPDNKLIKMLIDGIMYFLIQILTIINLLLKYILQFITADSIDFISKNIKYV